MNQQGQGHTVRRYDGEQGDLHGQLVGMGRLVLRQVRDAFEAFQERDATLAQQVITLDHDVDQCEVAADGEIVDIIARRSPLGGDLRWILAVSKSVSDLERIGDEAAKLAAVVTQLFGSTRNAPANELLRHVNTMGDLAVSSLEMAIDLFDQWDEDRAWTVVTRHRAMEEEFQTALGRLMGHAAEDTRNVGGAISVVLVLKSLERIGHHAHSLAEYALFNAKGEDVRGSTL